MRHCPLASCTTRDSFLTCSAFPPVQVPLGILWKGRYEVLPQEPQPLLAAYRQPRHPARKSSVGRRPSAWSPRVSSVLIRCHHAHPQTLVPKAEYEAASSELVPVVNTLDHGFGKVLGKGRLPADKPLIVKARFVSRRAEQKIKEAGGVVKIIA